jgi:hypothetical protein
MKEISGPCHRKKGLREKTKNRFFGPDPDGMVFVNVTIRLLPLVNVLRCRVL